MRFVFRPIKKVLMSFLILPGPKNWFIWTSEPPISRILSILPEQMREWLFPVREFLILPNNFRVVPVAAVEKLPLVLFLKVFNLFVKSVFYSYNYSPNVSNHLTIGKETLLLTVNNHYFVSQEDPVKQASLNIPVSLCLLKLSR